jgi:hypothetical protein
VPRSRPHPAPLALAAATLLAAACATGDALPSGPPRAPAETLGALRARTRAVSSLYGVVEIAYDGPDRRGTFDAVVHWRAPGELRLTAYKDLLLAAPDVFDLLLTPREWALVARPDGPQDDVRARRRGPRAELPANEPRFAAVHWVGEGMFLAGAVADEATVEEADGRQRVRTRLASGAPVTWEVDPRTLAVPAGEVEGEDGRRIALRFAAWRALAPGVLLPGEVELSDPRGRTRMAMRLREHELNPALDAATFRPESVLEAE